jgi:putative ABC transport system ATP-binding protein
MAVVASVQNLSKIYRKPGTNVEVAALRSINLEFIEGEYTAIMGASGSGKSTLMNIIGCLDQSTSGSYVLGGVDISKLEDDELSEIRSRRIGFIFQNFNLIPRTSALRNVELPLAYAGLSASERRERALEALDRVGLSDRVQHLPSELSGGQQQRVAVARAIVTEPVLLLADEPTGALDSHSTADVLELFDELASEGRTLVVITHEAEVARHAQRIIRMSDGLVVADNQILEAV